MAIRNCTTRRSVNGNNYLIYSLFSIYQRLSFSRNISNTIFQVNFFFMLYFQVNYHCEGTTRRDISPWLGFSHPLLYFWLHRANEIKKFQPMFAIVPINDHDEVVIHSHLSNPLTVWTQWRGALEGGAIEHFTLHTWRHSEFTPSVPVYEIFHDGHLRSNLIHQQKFETKYSETLPSRNTWFRIDD